MSLADREIPPLDRVSFYAFLGLLQVMEPDTEELMRERAEREWRAADHARGHFWSTSFHASSFPGDDRDACPRALAYTMMGFAPTEPMPPWVTATGDVGKAIEMSIVRAWYEGGRSLIVPEDLPGGGQLVFEFPEYWLTGSVDLPILKKGWNKPHIVEIKCKESKVVEEMRNQTRRWDDSHRRQLLATLGLANRHDWGRVQICEETWRIAREGNPFLGEEKFVCREHENSDCLIWLDLDPPDTGSIYYADRSWPRKTIEFFFKHDQSYMDQGLEVLDSVREHFIADEIPARPDNFQWSMGACKWCRFKKTTCKPDFIKKTHRDHLSKSHGVSHTQELRSSYDTEVERSRVIDRWSDD